MTTSSIGRPALNRNRTAGNNLRTALKLLGKTWRKDTESPDHVHHWPMWSDCGLPRSANTIDTDLRLGVPEQRIRGYAACLGISPEALCAPDSDMVHLLRTTMAAPGQAMPALPLGHMDQFPEYYQKHNLPSYIQELFSLVGGVYRMYYLLDGVDRVHRCTFRIRGHEGCRLLVRARFTMFGNENTFNAAMFRWHNNLHTHYLCENGLELGYLMTVDPLRHNLVQQRSPFWLRGTGMTDRGLADNQPITLIFRMQKRPRPEGMPMEELWLRECQSMRERPFIGPDEADYQRIRTQILTPEVLTGGDL